MQFQNFGLNGRNVSDINFTGDLQMSISSINNNVPRGANNKVIET